MYSGLELRRALIIEDDPGLARMLMLLLSNEGIIVEAVLSSVEEAQTGIKKYSDVDMIFLDGNLSKHSENGKDGKELIPFIRAFCQAVIIWTSVEAYNGSDTDAPDVRSTKTEAASSNVLSRVREILIGRDI